MTQKEKEILTAANNGDPEAQYKLAVKYFKEGKKANAVNWYEKSAQSGHFLSMVALIGRYLYDRDIAHYWSRAYAWFKKAREADEKRLFVVYANLFEGEKLCDEGEYDAALKKGFMGGYFGLAESSDEPEYKFAYYKQGCDWGDINCYLGISECLKNGVGCAVYADEAEKVYKVYVEKKKEIDKLFGNRES
ncbi:MAG: sel1 repeat family protein [Clostridia bacterium]|nr:sel1 repeat family protein [Clostridia bacterium]